MRTRRPRWWELVPLHFSSHPFSRGENRVPTSVERETYVFFYSHPDLAPPLSGPTNVVTYKHCRTRNLTNNLLKYPLHQEPSSDRSTDGNSTPRDHHLKVCNRLPQTKKRNIRKPETKTLLSHSYGDKTERVIYFGI